MKYEVFDAGNGYYFLQLSGTWYYWRAGLSDWVLYPVSNEERTYDGSMSFQQWAADHGTITQRPDHPATYIAGRKMHGGWDIAKLPEGEPIHAFRAGTVVEVTTPPSGWGNSVVVRDRFANLHRYAHFREQIMQKGQPVAKGQVVGNMGRTGNVFGKTGVHVHYEVKNPKGQLLLSERDFDSIPT